MRILLDSNVALRLVEPGHVHQRPAAEAIGLLQSRGHDLVLVPQTLYEFWSVATRPAANNGLGMAPAEAQAEISSLKRLFVLLRDERAIYELWEGLVATLEVKGKQAHDARLAAAMQRHQVTHLLTFNVADFTRYSALHAISPLQIVAGTVQV